MKKKLHEQAKIKSERKQEARKKEDVNILKGVGLFGIVGWSVVVPTFIGVALGIWLDTHYKRGAYSWTLMCLFLGIVLGCILAWQLSKREISNKDKEK